MQLITPPCCGPRLLHAPAPDVTRNIMFCITAGHGKIINTASMASLLVPHPQKQIAYNASKSAVVKMTQTLGEGAHTMA